MKKFVSKLFLKYLQTLTRWYVKHQNIEIIGLTGSAGKTSLTLAIHAVLSKEFKTAMTYQQGHGLNSETGIPFALLGVHIEGYSPLDWLRYLLQATYNFFFKKCPYEKFVLEMGVDKPTDMEHLLSMVQPEVGIFLSIAKVHAENFEHLFKRKAKSEELLAAIFEEKAKLVRSLPRDGWAVLSFDNSAITNLSNFTKAKSITFGLKTGADVRGVVKNVTVKRFDAEIIYKGEKLKFTNKNYLMNERFFRTLLAAFSVGVVYNIDPLKIVDALEHVPLPSGRMTKISGIRDTLIIDSSYNASTPAMLEALDNLALFKNHKKIAVLGDMRELGVVSEREHKLVAIKASEVADEMVLIGPAMRRYFLPEAVKQGFDRTKIHHFNNTWKALDFIKKEVIKGGEVILIKGSQNTLFLEIIVEALMRYPARAEELLCRRGKFWEKKRQRLKDL